MRVYEYLFRFVAALSMMCSAVSLWFFLSEGSTLCLLASAFCLWAASDAWKEATQEARKRGYLEKEAARASDQTRS